MERPGGRFGIVILLLVVAVVMFLAARSWLAVAPEAYEVLGTSGDPAARELGRHVTGEVLRTGELPNLEQMRERTREHEQQVRRTLAEVD